MAENLKISKSTEKYWDAVKDLIDAAGDYAWAVKLKANLLDGDTASAVQPVLDEYHGGSMASLDEAIFKRQELFYAKVNKVNILCLEHEVMTITKPDRLLHLLLREKRRKSYRGKMATKRKKNIICPLQDFERKK